VARRDIRGRRRPDGTACDDLERGDYARDPAGGGWYVCDPEGNCGRLDPSRSVTEHSDGTVTVSPAVWAEPGRRWRGWVERGVWKPFGA
jgi:hypothetical protein